jgi:hypothetical protein
VFLVMYFFPLPVVSRRRSNLYTSVYFSLTLLVLSLASTFFFSLIRYFFVSFSHAFAVLIVRFSSAHCSFLPV